MDISDTFVVVQCMDMATDEHAKADDVAAEITKAVSALTQTAYQRVAQEKADYRTYALAATPLLVPQGDKRLLFVTTIVALVQKDANPFPWTKPDWIRKSTN